MDTNDRINVLNIYFEDWKYRHENFWKRLNQFTVIIFFTTTLPITFRIFDNLTLPDMSLLFFPICGILLSIMCLFFCWSENCRLVAVDKTIKKILKIGIGERYTKEPISLFNNEKLNHRFEKFPFFKWRIGTWVPLVITILQIALAILVICLIVKHRL